MNRNDNNTLLSFAQINALDMVEILEALGHIPTRKSFPHHWYLSPLREEKTASFKVNSKLNAWWDFGIQIGGNLLKFLAIYYRCPVQDVPHRLTALAQGRIMEPDAKSHREAPENPIKNLAVRPLTSPSLLRYLSDRRILQIVAQKFCWQATYSINGKNFYAVAFPNRSGGYELRNPYFKGSTSPKDITLIKNDSTTLSIFEGFTDFLSIETATYGQPDISSDHLILNTLGFLSRCQPVIPSYTSIRLYLDNDPAGNDATAQAMGWSSTVSDQRQLYQGHKDPNDWLCHIGSGQVQKAIAGS